jgi:transcription initiation factor TFIID TATA-box-binding protein
VQNEKQCISTGGLERELECVNIALNFNLSKKLDLHRVKASIPTSKFDPKKFNALVYKIRKPKCTALIFTSGKVTLLGCKNNVEIVFAIKNICDKLKLSGFSCFPTDLQFNNFAAVYNCGFQIRLNALFLLLPNCTYEPELFSGLIYRLPNSSISFMIFTTGKIIVTGSKSFDVLKEKLDELLPLINETCY